MLPRDNINRIKYFTALVNPRPVDPNQLTRQQTYLRALQTIPNLEIIYGHFLTHEIMMPLASPKSGYVKVIKTEEKGSDVNLALHLLSDGYKNAYAVAIVVSNDSELAYGHTPSPPSPTTFTNQANAQLQARFTGRCLLAGRFIAWRGRPFPTPTFPIYQR